MRSLYDTEDHVYARIESLLQVKPSPEAWPILHRILRRAGKIRGLPGGCFTISVVDGRYKVVPENDIAKETMEIYEQMVIKRELMKG